MENKYITQGQCLCGTVKFTLKGNSFGLYQCHCSECRKITGSNANSSVIVPEDSFSWLEGKEKISSYIHSSGYRSDFCSTCGSPTPNKMSNKHLFWVPAGTLNQNAHMEVKAHLCLNSIATWDASPQEGKKYEEVPSFDELLEVISANK